MVFIFSSKIVLFKIFLRTIKLGIILIILSAFFLGSVSALTKQTANVNIHWSVVNLSVAFIGLPLNLLLSFLFYYFGLTKISEKGASAYVAPVLLSALSSFFKLLGVTFSTLAFKFEEATKVRHI